MEQAQSPVAARELAELIWQRRDKGAY